MNGSKGQATMTVAIVDPRGYTPPYDSALCDALAGSGCSVLLGTGEPGEWQWEHEHPFPVWNGFCPWTRHFPTDGTCSILQRGMQVIDYAVSRHRFKRLLQREKPDIIHFQWLPLPVLDQLNLLSLRKKAKLVLTLHNTTLFHGTVSRSRAIGFSAALKLFDAVVVHTNFSRRRVIERGWMDESRLHVIPHGVFHHYGKVSVQPARTASEKRLLFFGNLQPYKGVDTLLKAFSKMPSGLRQTIRLTIAGRPIMNPEPLFELARQLGIHQNVEWLLRPIAETEVGKLFQACTAVVLPYREIDQSGVLMTAIACGRPIVASAVGGIPETIQDGVHGYLVSPNDPEALAQRLSHLLASEDRIREMEQSVQQLSFGEFAWSNIARRTMDLYRTLLGQTCTSEVASLAVSEAA